MSIPAPTAPEATPLLPVQRALRSPDCRYRVAAYYGAPPGRWAYVRQEAMWFWFHARAPVNALAYTKLTRRAIL
jgi:hypothetical protein